MDNLSAHEFFEYHCTDKNASDYYFKSIEEYTAALDQMSGELYDKNQQINSLARQVQELKNHIIEMSERDEHDC